MKLRITYDPRWGIALTDVRMEDECKDLEEECKTWQDLDIYTISRIYGNFQMIYRTILLYVRGLVDYKNITYVIGGEEHKLNKYGVIENLPDYCGRTDLDIAMEKAKFAMKLRQQERVDKMDNALDIAIEEVKRRRQEQANKID